MKTTFEKPDIAHKLRQFTNDEIDELLEKSTNFREIRAAHTHKLYTMMRDGEWEPSIAQPISIDKNGNLVNGYHRLTAARRIQEEAGRLIWWLVVTGINRKTTEANFDTGIAMRNVGEYLRKEGVKNYNVCAQIAGAHARYIAYGEKSLSVVGRNKVEEEIGKDSNGRPIMKDVAISPSEILRVWRSNRELIQKWASVASRLNTAKNGMPRAGVLAAVGIHLAKDVSESKAARFFDLLISGAELKEKDAVKVLRDKLHAEDAAKAKHNNLHLCAWVVKAWQAWMESREVTRIQFATVGDAAEEFPDHRLNSNNKPFATNGQA